MTKNPHVLILNSLMPHLASVFTDQLRYDSGNVLHCSIAFSVLQISTPPFTSFTVSHGSQTILLMYGMVLPGGTNTITSPLLSWLNLGVILSTMIKSFSSNVGDMLAHTTVYGLATKNLINNTIHPTNIRNDTISKRSKRKYLIFILNVIIYKV